GGHRRRLGRGHGREGRAGAGLGDRRHHDRAEHPIRLLPVLQPCAQRRALDRPPDLRLQGAARPVRREDDARHRHSPRARRAPRVRLGRGFLTYDRLIVAPGIDFQTEQIEGLAAAGDRVLHAWKAGPQTVALAGQLKEIPDDGVFVMSIPPAAYRCPPGPYERACQVAWYLKTRKPRAEPILVAA